MMKNFEKIFILTAALTLMSCATSEKEDVNESKAGSKKEKSRIEKQDVKSVDNQYSENVRFTLKEGKYKCEQAIEFEKEDWRKLLESGLSCIYNKDWNGLSKVADILSHNHLKAPWGAYYKSIIASEKYKDFQRAEWMANLALKKAPENEVIKFQMARIYWNTDRSSEAYDLMKDIQKKNKDNTSILKFLGDIEYKDRNFKEAEKYYSNVLSEFSNDLDYRAALAGTLYYNGKEKESLSHYKYVLRRSKNKRPLYFQIGEIYKKEKNWKYAKAYYERAMKDTATVRSIASLDQKKIKIQLDYVDQKLNAPEPKVEEKNDAQ